MRAHSFCVRSISCDSVAPHCIRLLPFPIRAILQLPLSLHGLLGHLPWVPPVQILQHLHALATSDHPLPRPPALTLHLATTLVERGDISSKAYILDIHISPGNFQDFSTNSISAFWAVLLPSCPHGTPPPSDALAAGETPLPSTAPQLGTPKPGVLRLAAPAARSGFSPRTPPAQARFRTARPGTTGRPAPSLHYICFPSWRYSAQEQARSFFRHLHAQAT